MVLSPLHGLNIVPMAHQGSHNPNDLLGGSQFHPDLAAQIELWTNLAFENSDDAKGQSGSGQSGLQAEESEGTARHLTMQQLQLQHQSPMDLEALLAGFMAPSTNNDELHPFSLQHQQQPTLLQLLAQGPPPLPTIANTTSSDHTSSTASEPRKKKARTSSSLSTSHKSSTSSPASASSPSDDGDPMSAAADKRRRNTMASARFRVKKKEREAALESKANELKVRVGELEKECEGLRRENGWLKGLVVGVTGAAQRGPEQRGSE
ncbi:hypothetical protein DL96DRAFT_1631130 [Flagelloscypha sp. PMI_526]|nr:hypothetical protein DL96DRAFT_1631130 [Flagelloscypha sp. PMI_526]